MKKSISVEKILRLILCATILCALIAMPAFAATTNTYAEAGAAWILDGVKWVALIVIGLGLVKNIAAKNVSGAIVLGILGAIVVALIASPTVFANLGNQLLKIVGLTS